MSPTLLLRVLLGVAVVIALGWAVFPAAALYQNVFTPHVMLAGACLVKLCAQGLGAWHGLRVARRFEPGNPARWAWGTVALGVFLLFLGQLALAPQQIATGTSPFPSIADVFFVSAYPALTVGFSGLFIAYHRAGFPLGSRAQQIGIVLGVVAGGAVFSYVVLAPLVDMSAPWLTALNLGYPVLDLLLLVPLLLLLRATAAFGASLVGKVWITLLAGMFFLCVGDVAFAYLSGLELVNLDAIMHATYMLGYGLIADGIARQARLL